MARHRTFAKRISIFDVIPQFIVKITIGSDLDTHLHLILCTMTILQNLSYLLHDFLEKAEGLLEVSLLGVDLDPILIERARQYNPRPDRIAFEHLDFLSEDCDGTLKRYLDSLNKTRFDVVFCFSITMWIHLNHGDNGLEKFIRKACELTETIVIEPQPWKCYANAARRLRKAKLGDFPLRKEMKYKGEPVRYIDHILTRLCDFKRDIVTANNEWGRKLLIYRRK